MSFVHYRSLPIGWNHPGQRQRRQQQQSYSSRMKQQPQSATTTRTTTTTTLVRRFLNSNNMNSNNYKENYGRGSEIWPPTNQDRAVQLQDSFPLGNIPDAVWDMTNNNDMTTTTATATATTTKKTWLDRFPALIAFGLLGWIRPVDVGLVATLSVYTALLTLTAASLRPTTSMTTSSPPSLPSLPPQGHIPQMVQNPMHDLSYSLAYDIWWRCGVGLGFVLPILTLAYSLIIILTATTTTATTTTASSSMMMMLYPWTTTVARPLFLLSCQALSELVCKDWLVPLPIRIWIPISYQITRLVYLGLGFVGLLTTTTLTAASTTGTGSTGSSLLLFLLYWIQALTGFNLIYTLMNVFGFLIPVALMRYMRAHFFAVEAASVTIHSGMEETLGLSVPSNLQTPTPPPPPKKPQQQQPFSPFSPLN